MASFRGLVGTLIAASLLSGCSSEDFNLSKLASTTVSGFTEKLGGLSLVKLGEKVGIRTDPKVKLLKSTSLILLFSILVISIF